MHEKAIKVCQAPQDTKAEKRASKSAASVSLLIWTRTSTKKRHTNLKPRLNRGTCKKECAAFGTDGWKCSFSEKKVHFIEKQSDTRDYEEAQTALTDE